MADIEINGTQYITTRLPVMKAWHVARKIFPYLVSTAAMARIAQEVALGRDVGPEKFEGALKTVSESISGMSTEDWNYVMNTCLAVVRRREGGNIRPVIQLNGRPEDEASLLFELEWDCATPIELTMEVCNADVIPSLPRLMSSLLGLRTPEANGAAGDPVMASSGSLTALSTS